MFAGFTQLPASAISSPLHQLLPFTAFLSVHMVITAALHSSHLLPPRICLRVSWSGAQVSTSGSFADCCIECINCCIFLLERNGLLISWSEAVACTSDDLLLCPDSAPRPTSPAVKPTKCSTASAASCVYLCSLSPSAAQHPMQDNTGCASVSVVPGHQHPS